MKTRISIVFGVLIITSMILAACAPPAAEPETVVETIIVTQEVEIEGETVIETVIVEVIVTPEPEVGEVEVPTVYYNWETEPPHADPGLATDTTSSNLIGSIFTPLTDIDDVTKEVVPALASWEGSEDATVWTFHLRDDVPWVQYNTTTGEIDAILDEDGNPRMTNAHDVVYAIKRVCDPNTASDYAWLLYTIDGCAALNEADPEADDFQDLYDAMAVEALDDYTVQFTLEFGAGFFPAVATMTQLFPVYQPIIEEVGLTGSSRALSSPTALTS